MENNKDLPRGVRQCPHCESENTCWDANNDVTGDLERWCRECMRAFKPKFIEVYV